MNHTAGAPRVTVALAAAVTLVAVCLGLLETTTLTGAAPAESQPRAEDIALAAALEKRDAASATRLAAIALKEDLGLPKGHPATSVLGPSAAADLPALLAAMQADPGAAARINNLGVALALRGWHQSAAVAFGGALMAGERLYAARPWESSLGGGIPSRIARQHRSSTTPNPTVVNVDNLQRMLGSGGVEPGQERYEFALGLLETASAHPSMRNRLRAMAEVYPPVISQALGAALRERSADGTAPLTFNRTYGGFAQYKGTFLRGLPSRRVTKPYERMQPAPPPAPAPRGQNPAGRSVWDRGEIWDDRGVYGFDPTTRLRAGEALVDIYRVELGVGAADLRQEYVAIVGGPMAQARTSPFKVMSLGAVAEIDALIDGFWRDLTVDREELDASRLASLAARLWQPLNAAMPPGTGRVWIAPDGALTRVPWQALGILSGTTAAPVVSVVDSGETIRESRPRPAQPSARILLAANPAYGAGPNARFARLPASAGEASAIAEIARTKGLEPVLLEGAAVTQPEIFRALPVRIVHLATHGEFRAALLQATPVAVGSWLVFDPELERTANPRLQLPPGMDLESLERRLGAVFEEAKRSNRPVTVDDIKRARDNVPELADVAQGLLALAGANGMADPWTPDSPAVLTDVELSSVNLTGTDLVVLSACDLGQTQQTAFQGLGSMQSAVVVAGARALLSSLWKIPDDEAAAFMKLFYTNLLVKGLPPADALRATQQTFSRDASGRPRSPFLWAGWVLFGEGW